MLKQYYKNRQSADNEKKERRPLIRRNKDDDEVDDSKASSDGYFFGVGWPFASSSNNVTHGENDDNKQNISAFPKPRSFSQLSWPTWNQNERSADNTEDSEGYLARTMKLFPLHRPEKKEEEQEGTIAKSKNYLKSKWTDWNRSSKEEEQEGTIAKSKEYLKSKWSKWNGRSS